MAREPQKTDYAVDVEGVGQFMFARRSMQDEITIQREFAKYLNGIEPTTWMAQMGGWLSDFRVLMVSSPPGWLRDIDGNPVSDLMEADPLDDETYATIAKVHEAFRDKERSFRRKPAQGGQA